MAEGHTHPVKRRPAVSAKRCDVGISAEMMRRIHPSGSRVRLYKKTPPVIGNLRLLAVSKRSAHVLHHNSNVARCVPRRLSVKSPAGSRLVPCRRVCVKSTSIVHAEPSKRARVAVMGAGGGEM